MANFPLTDTLRILRPSLTYFAKMKERLVWYDSLAGQYYMVLFIISCRIKVDISVKNIELQTTKTIMMIKLTMSWQQKSDLTQKDPATCARNFEHTDIEQQDTRTTFGFGSI